MLSDLKIRKAKYKESSYKLNDYDGLMLVVGKKNKRGTGTKSFSFRYTKNKKTYQKSIGKYPAISLSEARKTVEEYRLKIDRGDDPFEKTLSASEKSFVAISEKWLINTKRDISETHKESIEQRLSNHIFPKIGHKDMSEIKTHHILEIVNSLLSEHKNETAKRITSIVSQVMRYGVLCGVCDYDITAPLRGYVKKKEVKHMPALTDVKEIGEMLRAIWGYSGRVTTVYALRLSAYTFCRPKEIRTAEWSEIDFDKSLWVIPRKKMKMKRAHVVPLSDQCVSLLRQIQFETGKRKYVFSNPRRDKELGLSENAVNGALRRLDYADRMVAHGFRGMASTLLHEKGYNPLHIEIQLAHEESNKVKAAYNHATYLDERAKMMQEYDDYLDYLRENN